MCTIEYDLLEIIIGKSIHDDAFQRYIITLSVKRNLSL